MTRAHGRQTNGRRVVGIRSAEPQTLRLEPSGIELEVRPGETLMQAAWRVGLHWPTLCYGLGTCTACKCEVVEGLDNVTPRTEAEDAMLKDFGKRRCRVDPARTRLGCQVQLIGDVVIRKPGVRPKDTDPQTLSD